jgi:hypothetical protein
LIFKFIHERIEKHKQTEDQYKDLVIRSCFYRFYWVCKAEIHLIKLLWSIVINTLKSPLTSGGCPKLVALLSDFLLLSRIRTR